MDFLRRNNKEKTDEPDHFFRDLDIEFLIHELKSPLSIIETGMRTLLEKEDKFGKLSQKQNRTLKRSLKNTIKAREMIYTLLEIGRCEAEVFAFSEFSPGEAVLGAIVDSIEAVSGELFNEIEALKTRQDLLELLGNNSIFFTVSPSADDRTVYLDQLKLRHILANLIKNALYYKNKSIDIMVDIQGEMLSIDIGDDGPGIAPENHKSVFERYKQINTQAVTGRSGHGLGLAGAYILAKRLRGDIRIIGRKTPGALFRITLPVRQEPDMECRQ